MTVKYPQVSVKLIGEDGNSFSILGRVTTAMRREGISKEEIDAFRAEATNGDYNHLLCTVMDWVNTDDEDEESDENYWDEDEDDIYDEEIEEDDEE